MQNAELKSPSPQPSPGAPVEGDRARIVAQQLKERARAAGFDLVGVASVEASEHGDYFRSWLDAGKHGDMWYLAQRVAERNDLRTYLPGCKSVICVAMNYFVPLEDAPRDGVRGRVARYALGDDYHVHLRKRMRPIADWIEATFPGERAIACIDTSPIPEKVLAARAGVGWFGKNSCTIHPGIGSWLLLGEIVTTLALPPDRPATDHCGACTRCIDACPTGAITSAYQLDARKCISYLTIEHRGGIEPTLTPKIGDWLYGCDICQDVCPHNAKTPAATDTKLQPRFPSGTLNVSDISNWSNEVRQRELKGSAMKRISLAVLQRNAEIVKRNAGIKIQNAE